MVLWGRLRPGLEARGPRRPRQPLVESRNQSVCFLEDEVLLSVEACCEAACIFIYIRRRMEGISVGPV